MKTVCFYLTLMDSNTPSQDGEQNKKGGGIARIKPDWSN